ncbi:hypothetical protein E0H68_06355 [Rhizobium leguminosarum bv. viciae]|uniref:hypothetical protein n=1 Tax=Rhizobium leguminosarum TaxID=384 RepID=UPI00103977F4|nr:hypothetical protein [Rhizobium leguminosarum]TCA17392.1 hypothetical protein E0H68_06355 [Rhizobium leguminosarum bv. viciae]
MTRDEYDTICDWLRVKWLPIQEPSGDDIEHLAEHLSLSACELSAAVRAMSDDDAELFIELETARALYVDPIDRESGITEAKVARYPERYGRASSRTRTCRILQ